MENSATSPHRHHTGNAEKDDGNARLCEAKLDQLCESVHYMQYTSPPLCEESLDVLKAASKDMGSIIQVFGSCRGDPEKEHILRSHIMHSWHPKRATA